MKSAGSGRVRVVVQASDPISQAGLTGCLERRPELVVVPATRPEDADVVILAPTRLSASVLADMRQAAAQTGTPVVLVVDEFGEADLLTAIECRVVAVLPRAAATGERLLHSVLAAASGGGVLPPNLLGELLKHVERLQREVLAPHGLNSAGLSPREIDVLRLMAEGMDTVEIARELCYSERTVKNIIYGLTTRLNLRNRAHAVAYAMRAGMI
jgi:DNA-binding NarL/FixJ family response regulator